MANFWVATGIGMLLTFVVSVFMPSTVGILVLASLVCTAGLSLVIWIPVWWLIGTVVLAFVSSSSASNDLRSRKQDMLEVPPVEPSPAQEGVDTNVIAALVASPTPVKPVSRDLQMIVDYIRWERRHSSPSVIDQRLSEMGWSDDVIAHAHRIADV